MALSLKSERNKKSNSVFNGALFETYVVSEVLKSYWSHGKRPFVYFYRDTDNNREIDLLIRSQEKVCPIEIKLTSSPNLKMTKHFKVLDEKRRGRGAIICTSNEFSPISEDVNIIPVSYIEFAIDSRRQIELISGSSALVLCKQN